MNLSSHVHSAVLRHPPEHNEYSDRSVNPWSLRTLKSVFVPAGVILLGAVLLLGSTGQVLPPSGVKFFYYAVFVAALLLAWRFHSTRILFSAVVLMLGHSGIEAIAGTKIVAAGPGRIVFEAVALLLPLDYILLTFFPERGAERRTLLAFLALLFFESTAVLVFARPEQPDFSLLHFHLVRVYQSRLPQPALVVFVVAVCAQFVRIIRFQRPVDIGMFWSLIAAWVGLEAGGASKLGTAYFGVAGFILASSIVETSYSLAYKDELTGLDSRRAFNDAILGLKHPYVIAAVDIDHFKRINDTYGHDTGDHVLRLVASRLARVTGGGRPFRVGGEEFTILFAGRTTAEVADHLELLRMEIESASFHIRTGIERRKNPRPSDRRAPARKPRAASRPAPSALAVTVSIGAAGSLPKMNVYRIIQQADMALYRAKEGGRNRIEIAASPSAGPRKEKTRGSTLT